jgi:prophage regulatory protein
MPSTANPRAPEASMPDLDAATRAPNESDKPSLEGIKLVEARTAHHRASIYRKIKDGTFPRPIKCGKRVRWVSSEVTAWINARIQASRESAPRPETDQVA